ncbi:hypothetical protein BDY24DRAFT_393441 [Mrakia frigida]|uniref:uncharacterized protein n=1 Tax=Mrakia frigida TaxID=29902 RepID=UPI003FCC1E4A
MSSTLSSQLSSLRSRLPPLPFQLPYQFTLKLSNIVVYLTLCLFHVWNSFIYRPEYPAKETYLTPGKYVFWIWPVIHLLLIGYCVVQFLPSARPFIIDTIRYRFVLLGFINAAYLYFQIRKWYILAFLLSIALSSTVSSIYYLIRTRAKPSNPPPTRHEELFIEIWIKLPFSLYHAWSLVLGLLTMFQAFGKDIHKEHAGAWTKVFVLLSLTFLLLTSFGYAYASEAGDLAGTVIITYVLWAIFEHQQSIHFIHWSALVFAIFSSFSVIKTAISTVRVVQPNPLPTRLVR